MSALLFGSISTLADTSELQRVSFNKAFAAHHLGWTWSQQEYQAMLGTSGGVDRVASYAQHRGEDIDADAIHATKSKIFQREVATAEVRPRPYVADTITAAIIAGMKVGLVTTTSAQNITALLDALSPDLRADVFHVIVDIRSVEHRKPAGDAYEFAVRALNEHADHCIAVEDNIDGVTSAQAAGVACAAFPNENTTAQDFTRAAGVLHEVHLDALTALLPTR